MINKLRKQTPTRIPTGHTGRWYRKAVPVALLLGILATSGTSWANEPVRPIDPAALHSLARDFVTKIGGKLQRYNADSAALSSATENPLSLIPDGELLLLRPRTDKFVMDGEIGTIKNGPSLYFSFDDLITQLELAIEYNRERGTGSGWYLREDWLVRFDFNKSEIVSRDKTYTIDPSDIYKEGSDVYVSEAALRKWFSMNLDTDLAQQYLNIKTPYPYAPLARNYRERNVRGTQGPNASVLPRAEVEESMFDINFVETQHNVRVDRPSNGKTRTSQQNITSASGEVLKHNAYGLTLWDDENNISSVRARLSKESENPDLLGPLGARYYELGDVSTPQVPLTETGSQALGVRINNNPLRNADFQRTTISGDSLPGWDVELYRDGFLIDRIRVEEDARYEFANIELFAGDNLFEVFFYGPQGEIRKDNFNIPVDEKFLATQDNTYDVALTFRETQLYSAHDSESEDKDTPELTARYNKLIGNTLAYAGVRTHQKNGEQKSYLGTGFTNVWNGYVLDANAALDEQGSTALEMTTRKNIDNWRLSLTGAVRDEDYVGARSGVVDVLAAVNKPFLTPFNTRLSFNSSAQYREMANDDTEMTGRVGLSHQFGRLTLSDTVSYQRTELADETQGSPEDVIQNTLAGRMRFGKLFTSAGINHTIKPESEIDSYFGQLTYHPAPRFSTDLRVEHKPQDKYSQAHLNVNYRHDKFRVTPFVNIDSNDRLQTGVRLSTTFVDDPGQALPAMTYQRLTGNGLVSSFVFHDKNGNNIFDDGDEPLPDVYVQSVNVSRRAKTNEKGYSLINNLPERIVTDIQIDKNTLPDPFMIPAHKGVSVFPKSGQMVNLVFPVHIGGEIDGTVTMQNGLSKIHRGGIPVHLFPVDGKTTEIITTHTANDGFYLFNGVPPGDYILSVDARSVNRARYGGGNMSLVTIGYEGTTIYGRNITLEKDKVQTPVEITAYTGKQYDRPFFALQTGSTAKSTLALTLEKLVGNRTATLRQELAPFPLDGTQDLTYMPGRDLMEHYERCAALNDARFPCKVILYIPEKSKDGLRTAAK